jgi:hypothetical protein
LVHGAQFFDRLGFHDHSVVHQKVEPVGVGNQESIESDGKGRLHRHAMPSLAKGVGEAMAVGLLEKARPQGILHPDGGGQNGLGER